MFQLRPQAQNSSGFLASRFVSPGFGSNLDWERHAFICSTVLCPLTNQAAFYSASLGGMRAVGSAGSDSQRENRGSKERRASQFTVLPMWGFSIIRGEETESGRFNETRIPYRDASGRVQYRRAGL
jgi:hypothetical protein